MYNNQVINISQFGLFVYFEKILKKLKKTLYKLRFIWYYIQAVERTNKKLEEIRRNPVSYLLDNGFFLEFLRVFPYLGRKMQ